MKYTDLFGNSLLSSSLILFIISLILQTDHSVKYIMTIDSTILIEIVLILTFSAVMIEFVGGFIEK